MFSLFCAWINAWVNNREAGDSRRHIAHYDVIVMNITDMVIIRYCYIGFLCRCGCDDGFMTHYVDGLVQDYSISIVNALEILQSCTKPSMCPFILIWKEHYSNCFITGFIAVREMSGRNKISQGQGIVREFYKVSGKFWHLAKLMKNVMEFHIMSGKMTILGNMTLQLPYISTN